MTLSAQTRKNIKLSRQWLARESEAACVHPAIVSNPGECPASWEVSEGVSVLATSPGPLGCSLFGFLAIMTHAVGSAVTIKGLQRERARLPGVCRAKITIVLKSSTSSRSKA